MPDLSFSFSGIKTAFLYFLRDNLAEDPDFVFLCVRLQPFRGHDGLRKRYRFPDLERPLFIDISVHVYDIRIENRDDIPGSHPNHLFSFLHIADFIIQNRHIRIVDRMILLTI